MRGRKPKPTNLVVIEGNPGKRPIKKELDMKSEMPQPPEHLDDYARDEWNRLAEGMYALKILYEVDRAVFAAYCEAYSRWRHASEELNKLAETNQINALILKTVSGNYIQQPLIGIANTAMRDMVKYAAEFGLSPSARARLAIDPNKGQLDDDRLLYTRKK